MSYLNNFQFAAIITTNLVSHFSLLARKDLRDLFDQLSVTRKSKTRLNSEKSRSAPELCASIPGQRKIGKIIIVTLFLSMVFKKQHPVSGLLTRNSSLDTEFTDAQCAQKKIFNAIAASSILANCAGIDTSSTQVITCSTLRKFLEARQMEIKSEEEVRSIIKVSKNIQSSLSRLQILQTFRKFSRDMNQILRFALKEV